MRIICRALQPRKVLTSADLCQSHGSDRATARYAESCHIVLPSRLDLLRLLCKPSHSACHIFCRSRFEKLVLFFWFDWLAPSRLRLKGPSSGEAQLANALDAALPPRKMP